MGKPAPGRRSACVVASILASLLVAAAAGAQWRSVGNVDSLRRDSPASLLVHAGPTVTHVSIPGKGVARIRFGAHEGMPGAGTSWAVTGMPPPAAVRIEEGRDHVRLLSPEISVEVGLRPLRIRFLDAGGEVINEDSPSGMSWSGRHVRIHKSMPPGEEVLGFGEKAGRLRRRDSHMTMWNSDIPAYAADTDPLYQSIPFFLNFRSGRAHGLFLDSPRRSSFDMGKEIRDEYSFGAEGNELDYYVIAGPKPRQILERFTGLTGRMPLPPRWSLGYQQCRWSYAPEARVREIAGKFRSLSLPCDVLYLDIDYMDGYRVFTWHPSNFPDPPTLLRDLAGEGFKTVVIIDPGIKADTSYHAFRSGLAGNHFVRKADGSLYIGDVWPGPCAFPDFANAAARAWWGEQFGPLLKDGIRGFWTDMNEPSVFNVPTKTIDLDALHRPDHGSPEHAAVHNVYGLQMTRATREGVAALAPRTRPFILTRASYAGGQRYAAAWTGDNVASWEHLRMALTMSLGLSISGQPFVGSDIGGFIGMPTGELFARWLQLGIFTPLMRAHSVINERNKEPWEFGDRFTAINRGSLELRYRLLPYLYTVMEHASRTGEPAMRPVAYAYPSRSVRSYDDDQFLLGADLLVAPVLSEGMTQRNLYLPPGQWWSFWEGAEFPGDTSITVKAPIDRIPFFVRGGAALPLQQVVQYTDQASIDPLTLLLYPPAIGEQGKSSYYEDDGNTTDYLSGVYLRREISQDRRVGERTVTLSAAQGTYRPPARRLLLRFAGMRGRPRAVSLNGGPVAEGRSVAAPPSWHIDRGSGDLVLVLRDTRETLQVRVIE